MKNLISMTDFVLEQYAKKTIGYDEFCTYVVNYANFLKQPLELWMFIPCDEKGNVLEEPEPHYTTSSFDDCPEPCYDELECKQYQQAKERCLFKWFAYDQMGFAYLTTEKGCGFDEEYMQNKTIEYLVKYNLQLTETAIKQLSL